MDSKLCDFGPIIMGGRNSLVGTLEEKFLFENKFEKYFHERVNKYKKIIKNIIITYHSIKFYLTNYQVLKAVLNTKNFDYNLFPKFRKKHF